MGRLGPSSHDPIPEVDEGQRGTISSQSQRMNSLPSRRDGDISSPFQYLQDPFPIYHITISKRQPLFSARFRAHFIRRALCPHLTLNPPRLPPRCTSRALRLLGLLLAFSCSFLLLALRDGFLAGCFSGFGSLRAAVFDQFEGGADDATLLFYGTAGALLGDFLDERDVLVIRTYMAEMGYWRGWWRIVRGRVLTQCMESSCRLPVYNPAPLILYPSQSWRYVLLTSEIPFLCCLRYSVVHAMRRGFFRWRKRDSVLPFWKRKILLSPRT